MGVCKILIVEDESLVAMDMVDMLTRPGYNVLPNGMGYHDAIGIIENGISDLELVDINLSGTKTGIDLAFGTICFTTLPALSTFQPCSSTVNPV